jgi:caa(3)-type oxidase subunit IV
MHDTRTGANEGKPPDIGRLLLTWISLLVLGVLELGASFLPIDGSLRPLIMIPAVSMVILVAVNFMEVGKGPVIVRAFAVAAAFWLLVLLALGSVDPLTRTDYYVPRPSQPSFQP